jgi:hypothetical protein
MHISGSTGRGKIFPIFFGGLAQLARAPALHAGGQRFESVILHNLGFDQETFFDILELIEVVIELIENYNE